RVRPQLNAAKGLTEAAALPGAGCTPGLKIASMRQDPSGWSVRLDEDIASSYVRSGQWHNRTLAHDFAHLVADDPDWPAIVQADTVVTRRELLTQAQALAGSLLRLGLGTGTVLSVMLPNWPEVAIVDLAAAITGMVLNP